jgi:uncharacterized surface protein with fasciclin (FAS1) repeats
MSSDLSTLSSVTALNGDSLQIQKKRNVIHVGDARIRQTNLEAENGIIHVVDRVLIPE